MYCPSAHEQGGTHFQLQLAPTLKHQARAIMSIMDRYGWQIFSIITGKIAGHRNFDQARKMNWRHICNFGIILHCLHPTGFSRVAISHPWRPAAKKDCWLVDGGRSNAWLCLNCPNRVQGIFALQHGERGSGNIQSCHISRPDGQKPCVDRDASGDWPRIERIQTFSCRNVGWVRHFSATRAIDMQIIL